MSKLPQKDEELWERRGAIRQDTGAVPVIVRDSEGVEHRAVLVNVSRNGLRIGVAAGLPRGSEVLVTPAAESGLRPIRAKVVREELRPSDDDLRAVYGLKFTDAAEIRRHAWWLTLRKAA